MRIGLIIILVAGIGYMFFSSCKSKTNNAANNIVEKLIIDSTTYQIGDTITPFENYNFSQGSWKAEIKISSDDNMDLSKKIPKAPTLTTTNKILLEKIRNWKFIYTNGDMTTVLNNFKLFKGDSVVASYGIVLDENTVGLQSQQYGWIPALDSSFIFETIKMFDK
ncbi:MAG: hypothetical protein KF741_04265 [Ferruginibacter sp.]|nr:hypothetical protein [Bacteroidota bacterium]MBX2918438.1 hypothetical protein [Ferruginibacter sp.]MCB0708631.1 hypothetical protein [Chitinophagaceae bacterium]